MNIATEFDKFEDVLFNKRIIKHKMKRIQSKKHKLGTYEIDKISLSYFEDKRYVLDDEFILWVISTKIVSQVVIIKKIVIVIIIIVIIIIIVGFLKKLWLLKKIAIR